MSEKSSKTLRYFSDAEMDSQNNSEYETVGKSETSYLEQSYFESSQTNLSLSNPNMKSNDNDTESFSGDNACGEPFIPQHIIIDFTPNETDTEFVQNKVSDFWDFVDAHPELQACIVQPDIVSETETASSSKANPKPTPPPPVGRSAVSMMSLITKKEIASPALNLIGTCIPDTDFTYLDQSKYVTSKTQTIPPNIKSTKVKYQHGFHTTEKLPCICSPCSGKEVKKMCESLNHWDELHPTTFDPPGPTPPILPEI